MTTDVVIIFISFIFYFISVRAIGLILTSCFFFLFDSHRLCAGQSNMQLAMAGAFDADADIADSGNYPLMRFATIKMQAYTTPVSFHTLISERRTVGN